MNFGLADTGSLSLSLNQYLHLREARAIQTDERSFQLGTLTHVLLATNTDPQHRSEVPKWHEIFPPTSIQFQNALNDPPPATGHEARELPAPVAGKLLDAFALQHKQAAKKRRGKRK